MISVITAIYNQRAANEIFWENLKLYTHQPFELIIIDNGSTDGSAEFFETVGARVISNHDNYSYPHSQNQGIAIAKYDWLAFLNNDIIVSPDWDLFALGSMHQNELDVATVCGIEQVENATATKKLKRRWKKIKNLLGILGYNKTTLKLMHKWMYGDWRVFCRDRQQRFAGQIKEGFVGNTVIMHRRAIEKIGMWDERIQAADFDLYLRSKQRAEQVGDMKPVHLLLDVFNHHFIRLTAKGQYPAYKDRENLIELKDKWPEKCLEKLLLLNQ